MFEPLSVGLLVSIVWGAIGYAVAKAKNDEAFNALKFAKTLLIGIAVSSVANGLGIPVAEVEGLSFIGFVTAVIDKVSSLLVKGKSQS